MITQLMHRAHAAQAEEGRAEQRTGYYTLGRATSNLVHKSLLGMLLMLDNSAYAGSVFLREPTI